MAADLVDLDLGRVLDREAADAGAEGDEGQRAGVELLRLPQRRGGRAAHDVGRRAAAGVHHRRGVDHPAGGQLAARRLDRLAEADRRPAAALLVQRGARGARDRAGHAAAVQEVRVGRVGDGVDLQGRDVRVEDLDLRHAADATAPRGASRRYSTRSMPKSAWKAGGPAAVHPRARRSAVRAPGPPARTGASGRSRARPPPRSAINGAPRRPSPMRPADEELPQVGEAGLRAACHSAAGRNGAVPDHLAADLRPRAPHLRPREPGAAPPRHRPAGGSHLGRERAIPVEPLGERDGDRLGVVGGGGAEPQATSAGSSLPCRRSRPRWTAAMNFERLTSSVLRISSA